MLNDGVQLQVDEIDLYQRSLIFWRESIDQYMMNQANDPDEPDERPNAREGYAAEFSVGLNNLADCDQRADGATEDREQDIVAIEHAGIPGKRIEEDEQPRPDESEYEADRRKDADVRLFSTGANRMFIVERIRHAGIVIEQSRIKYDRDQPRNHQQMTDFGDTTLYIRSTWFR